ncbi:MAG: hypothetical protein MHM6MM_001060 [Cercozoa sp. M6MM]
MGNLCSKAPKQPEKRDFLSRWRRFEAAHDELVELHKAASNLYHVRHQAIDANSKFANVLFDASKGPFRHEAEAEEERVAAELAREAASRPPAPEEERAGAPGAAEAADIEEKDESEMLRSSADTDTINGETVGQICARASANIARNVEEDKFERDVFYKAFVTKLGSLDLEAKQIRAMHKRYTKSKRAFDCAAFKRDKKRRSAEGQRIAEGSVIATSKSATRAEEKYEVKKNAYLWQRRDLREKMDGFFNKRRVLMGTFLYGLAERQDVRATSAHKQHADLRKKYSKIWRAIHEEHAV